MLRAALGHVATYPTKLRWVGKGNDPGDAMTWFTRYMKVRAGCHHVVAPRLEHHEDSCFPESVFGLA